MGNTILLLAAQIFIFKISILKFPIKHKAGIWLFSKICCDCANTLQSYLLNVIKILLQSDILM